MRQRIEAARAALVRVEALQKSLAEATRLSRELMRERALWRAAAR
jgi:hypothetical protein